MTVEYRLIPQYAAQEQEIVRKRYPHIAKTARSIIKIKPYKNNEPLRIGTGVVTENNLVLTAAHVLENASSVLFISLKKRSQVIRYIEISRLKHLNISENLDIASFTLPDFFENAIPVCRYELKNPNMPFTNSEKGFLIGFPKISGLIELTHSDVMKKPFIYETTLWAHGNEIAAIWEIGDPHGLSGGAMLNKDGELRGIVQRGENGTIYGAHVSLFQSKGLL